MLAMIALKHNLGDQIDLESKGGWDFDWNRPPGRFLRFQAGVRPVRSSSMNIFFPSVRLSRTS